MIKVARKLLALAGAVALTASAAGAQLPVVFSTSGGFYTGANAPSSPFDLNGGYTVGGSTLTYYNLTDQPLTVYPGGSSTNFGKIQLQSTSSAGDDLTGLKFRLNLFQTVPSNGTSAFLGALDGTIYSNGGLQTLSFTNTSISFGDITYSIQPSYTLASPITGDPAGFTTIQGVVTTPEPASMTLLATGLVGIFGAARRKRKATAA